MTTKDRMISALRASLQPVALDVIDESHLHAGHGGWRESGETHFRVKVVSANFAGKSRIERHRIINALLASELDGGVHALAIEASAPAEAALQVPSARL